MAFVSACIRSCEQRERHFEVLTMIPRRKPLLDDYLWFGANRILGLLECYCS